MSSSTCVLDSVVFMSTAAGTLLGITLVLVVGTVVLFLVAVGEMFETNFISPLLLSSVVEAEKVN